MGVKAGKVVLLLKMSNSCMQIKTHLNFIMQMRLANCDAILKR